MESSADSNTVKILGIIVLILLVYFIVKRFRSRSTSDPQSLWLNPEKSGALKDMDAKLIDFYHQVLSRHIVYYKNLDHAGRKKFMNRLHDVIEQLSFVGKDGQEINLQVSTLCCAPLIQITMGLENYQFNRFHTIVVYPQKFYSESQGTYVKGGVTNGDAIFFSYEDLLKGYAVPNDALNLGLHEMAHAVHIEYFDEAFERRFPQWEKIAEQEVIKMRYQDDPILRNYAGQNKHELFAVCIETFFEQSAEMNEKAPGLYEAMCPVLNQRPAERMGY